ncbi:hypothetical protein B0T14DRAFT_497335 [Immersiella caudata]|uniref:F-box domain-containing protein n=1 Tax=Immersiella caudata TaxID=314043 RepID=A0AA40C0X9_9PEZI|nr:hypothetical protein B0T14DRAFT_497335 [Immersiella caudata]
MGTKPSHTTITPRFQQRLIPSTDPKLSVGLPTEIIDQILTHLPPESALAFALTCRYFYAKHFNYYRATQLSPTERLNMLYLLERDVPHLYLCHHCWYLHTWRHITTGRNRRFHTSVISRGRCISPRRRNAISGGLFVPDFLWELRPRDIRLAMNRHVLGSLHGPPLSTLGGSRLTTCEATGVSRAQFWSGQVINDNLYLHGTDTFQPLDTGPLDKEAPRNYIEAFPRLLICPHLLTHSKVISSSTTKDPGYYSIPELIRDPNTGAIFRPIAGPVRSCPVCCTDYQIHIKQRRGRFTMQITKWQKLGSCHSTSGSAWEKLVALWDHPSPPILSIAGEAEPSVLRAATHAAGQVRAEWNRVDVVKFGEAIEGTFVS